MYKSPFRNDDESPSFNIFIHKNSGRLFHKDFGTGDYGDCIQLVQKLHNNCSFMEALQIVNQDFNLGLEGYSQEEIRKRIFLKNPQATKEEMKFNASLRKWQQYDLEYWNKYRINLQALKYFKVFPVEQAYVNSSPFLSWFNQTTNPLYGYWFGKHYWKFYRPLSEKKEEKWRTNIGEGHLQGWNQLLKEGKLCVITKSLKDVIVFRMMEIQGVAPHGETYPISPEIIGNLHSRFDRIIIFYDNDEEGIQGADKLSEKYGLEYVYIPTKFLQEEKIKDISDFVAEYGLIEAMNLLNKLYVI
jgi:DNA primase